MSRARFLVEAEAEFLHEVGYYARVQANGAELFRRAVEEATARALTFPLAGLTYLKKTRRVFVRGYPLFLVYGVEPEGIVVFAVAHESRKQGYWRNRAP